MVDEKPESFPWHVPVKVDDIPEAGRHFTLTANEATRAAIALYADVRSVERLDASFDVARKGRAGLRVTGQVRGLVGQNCVVSLDPIENEVVESVAVDFVPAPQGQIAGPVEVLVHHSDDDDAPEYLVDGGVDLGALAVEFLILAIDPYPRKPGVDFSAPKAEGGESSPFAALASLKKPPGGAK
jgi:hypothetical protein